MAQRKPIPLKMVLQFAKMRLKFLFTDEKPDKVFSFHEKISICRRK